MFKLFYVEPDGVLTPHTEILDANEVKPFLARIHDARHHNSVVIESVETGQTEVYTCDIDGWRKVKSKSVMPL
jgi:hypothetical protein